ncbi:MAG: YlmH/Sll1252 family protein [Bacillota bacterium]|nr:YlmH/Sll1252 family protein [Bacillota bacterium]
MENDELIKRAEDLRARCERQVCVTHTAFLTPAEQYALEKWAKFTPDCKMLLFGGHEECERKAAFFLPFYMEKEDFDASEYISVLRAKAGFGEPGHRDYMGAILGLGIKREWLGDIWVKGETAEIFCLPSVERHLLDSLDKVGRYGVKMSKASLNELEAPQRKVKHVTFSVKSLRFDAVVAGMFNLSRTAAAGYISAGDASLNYSQCLKTDAPVHEGDVISLRGCGKGIVGAEGGKSRKDRIFVNADIFK